MTRDLTDALDRLDAERTAHPRYYIARVGSRGDTCDDCQQTIAPHKIAYAGTDGRLICESCHAA